MTTLSPPRTREARSPAVHVLIGVAGFVISVVGSWIPSLWRDEAATANVAGYRLSDILGMVEHVDAVYGLYYSAMHYWLSLAGTDPFTLRLPSAVAVGIGAAAVAATGARLQGRGLAIAAGLTFALLPRMTAMGIEARSYALCAAAIAVLGWLLLVLREKTTMWIAALYALVGVVAVYLHLYAILAVGALWVSGMLLPRVRRARLLLSIGTGGAVVAMLPLLWLAKGQSSAQISWLDTPPTQLLTQVLVEQYFPFKTVVRFTTPDQWGARAAAYALAVVAASLLVLFLVRKGDRLRHRIVVFTVPSVVLPTAAVVAYSFAVSPAYAPKYLIGTVPAFALLLGAAVMTISRMPLRIAAVLLLLGLAAPIYLGQRQPYGKFVVDDYSFIADTVHEHSRSGDLILFEDGNPDPVDSGRNALAGYPDAFAHVVDVGAVPVVAKTVGPWSSQRPFEDVVARVEASDRVWLVTTNAKDQATDGERAQLAVRGFHVSQRYTGPTHEVLLLSR